MDCIRKHHSSFSAEAILKQQEAHLENYLDRIDLANPVFLKAVINPEPLMSQNMTSVSKGSPDEAHEILGLCGRTLTQLPGAYERIASTVGHEPQYQVKLSTLDPSKIHKLDIVEFRV